MPRLAPLVRRRRPARRRALAGFAFLLVAASGVARAASGPAPAPAIAWRRADAGPERGTAWLAVASDGRVALGDADGVAIGPPGGPIERAARLAGVSDLAFDRSGALWVATGRGLWWIGDSGPERRGPAPGEDALAVTRIEVAGRWRLALTAAGAYASADGRRFVRLAGPPAREPVVAGALRPDPALPERRAVAWVAGERDLWRARLEIAEAGDGWIRTDAERRSPPVGRPLETAPVDLVWSEAIDAPEGAWALLYPRHLALWRDAEDDRGPRDPGRVVVLELPPGASARRLAHALGRLLIAHDRGLSISFGPEGPWRRADPPAGRVPVHALAEAHGTVLLATEEGLIVGRAASPAAAPTAAPSDPREPAIDAVHAAVLRYLDLQPEVVRARTRGLLHRGWLPALSLRGSWNDGRRRGWDDDESFVSGDYRFLRDRDGDRSRDYDAQVTLTWDLRSLAYDDAWDDLSREARQIIALRDDVLDEVNQLYFERRRLLAELVGLDPGDPDAVQRRWRAEELAAGLDAWTGGWFRRQIAPDPTSHPARHEENP